LELRKDPEFRKNTGTKNSRRTDSSGKHRNIRKSRKTSETPEVRLKRKISGNLDIRKKESRRLIRSRRLKQISAKRVQDANPGAGRSYGGCSQGEEPRGTTAEEPKCPRSLKLSLRGSVERQAQRRQDRLGEPWSRSV
jgi:hypothetical protein